ncbi:Remorin-like protein [Drosera capensis]
MAEEQSKLESPVPPTAPDTPPPPPPTPPVEEAPVAVVSDDVSEEKAIVPAVTPPPALAEPVAAVLESQALAEATESSELKPSEGSLDRDAFLARLETEKRNSLIKAWEESEKSKAENKAHKRLSSVDAWENSKKATIEADLKKIEATPVARIDGLEKLEKKKAVYAEKMKNKIAIIHKEAEEKRAIVEAKKGEDILKAEETAAKYRATGTTPKKLFGFF